jgi:glycosyltransferase involved in cell wall biosynthesis
MSRTHHLAGFIGPFPNGGVGTAGYWEAHTLGTAGHDVTVLYTGRTERETPAHWETHFAATAPFRYVDLGRWAEDHAVVHPPRDGYACTESETADAVLAWLQTRRFDLVLFQEFLGHGARALQARHAAAAFDGVRMATTLHSSRQWVYEGMKRLPASPADAAVDFLEKASARLADAAIFPSQHMADWAASRWRLAQPGAVIPYCFDTTLAQAPTAIEHSGPFRHLVFFGRLETRKGLHLFCQALAAPALRGQIDRVTFLGKPSSVEGQPSDTYIAAHMATLPEIAWTIIGDAGSFEAQTWLAAQPHVLVVAPSLVDNLPYAVIELYTRRIPFVSTAIGGIPDRRAAAATCWPNRRPSRSPPPSGASAVRAASPSTTGPATTCRPPTPHTSTSCATCWPGRRRSASRPAPPSTSSSRTPATTPGSRRSGTAWCDTTPPRRRGAGCASRTGRARPRAHRRS